MARRPLSGVAKCAAVVAITPTPKPRANAASSALRSSSPG
ncbi:Uncharacterised protein [Mycobacteroides abscessus subsp. abscessus]|nr:Uncharacterised protein [Mycobacteroides abscessus subsp. abscessus]